MSRIPMSFGGREDAHGRRSSLKMRLVIAAVIALIAVISYYGRPGDVNQITGESQRVVFNEEADEVQMGLAARREMTVQFGGPDPDPEAQAWVKRVGARLLKALDDSLEPGGRTNPYHDAFEFTLLAVSRSGDGRSARRRIRPRDGSRHRAARK